MSSCSLKIDKGSARQEIRHCLNINANYQSTNILDLNDSKQLYLLRSYQKYCSLIALASVCASRGGTALPI